MNILIALVLRTLAILGGAYLLPGVTVFNWKVAVLAAIVLGLLNAVFKPVLHIFALPITILTLGLFAFVINGFIILLTDFLVDGFEVRNIWWAILFSLVLTMINSLLDAIFRDEK
jgi:putative membrane protein